MNLGFLRMTNDQGRQRGDSKFRYLKPKRRAEPSMSSVVEVQTSRHMPRMAAWSIKYKYTDTV